MTKYDLDIEILVRLLKTAYKRGHQWARENSSDQYDRFFLAKAAEDYARKTISDTFKSGTDMISTAE